MGHVRTHGQRSRRWPPGRRQARAVAGPAPGECGRTQQQQRRSEPALIPSCMLARPIYLAPWPALEQLVAVVNPGSKPLPLSASESHVAASHGTICDLWGPFSALRMHNHEVLNLRCWSCCFRRSSVGVSLVCRCRRSPLGPGRRGVSRGQGGGSRRQGSACERTRQLVAGASGRKELRRRCPCVVVSSCRICARVAVGVVGLGASGKSAAPVPGGSR